MSFMDDAPVSGLPSIFMAPTPPEEQSSSKQPRGNCSGTTPTQHGLASMTCFQMILLSGAFRSCTDSAGHVSHTPAQPPPVLRASRETLVMAQSVCFGMTLPPSRLFSIAVILSE
eukprot:CAMPEP_0172742236 /NCGR_PEP_ID=MMETSP1074-20121228/129023_1 /TAXON_ID=2916 /ORGANISM="Ceratium fusus, Strain PA161109" /LENGTH=114 /DNA_ID=CAMNT_0013572743 /DNA_START=349 /DNA_END=693 /DNA_ORIENTATION=-